MAGHGFSDEDWERADEWRDSDRQLARRFARASRIGTCPVCGGRSIVQLAYLGGWGEHWVSVCLEDRAHTRPMIRLAENTFQPGAYYREHDAIHGDRYEVIAARLAALRPATLAVPALEVTNV